MDQQSSPFNDVSITEALPYEILEIICKYLPEKDRKNFALVCKTFYELVCEVERYKRLFVLTSYTVINKEFVDGMLFSKRKIYKVVIQAIGVKVSYTGKELAMISKVLQKHHEIKVLDLTGWLFNSRDNWRFSFKMCDANDLGKLLEFMPNLEEIETRHINIRASFFIKLTSLLKLQRVSINVNCYRTRWSPALKTALMVMIERLPKYRITFYQPTSTIKTALEKDFAVQRDWFGLLALVRS